MITLDQMSNINVPLLITIQKWILDNGGKAYMHFKIDEKCQVPGFFMKEETITIDASPEAVEDLVIDEKGVSFRARFNGLEQQLFFPFKNVYALSGGKNFEFSIGFPLINSKFKDIQETPKPESPVKKVSNLVRVK